MVYPTSLPADAASVAVFDSGLSPEFDITWSFTYELSNQTAGDEIGFCLFLQDALSAVAGGGVFGDHCSPLSDTSILASTGAASDHIDHIKTQMPYALLIGFISVLIYLGVGWLL